MNRYIFLLSFSLILFSLNAQPELKFTRYTSQQNLVSNDVLSIFQDQYGFMWFGTKHGCSRFDGIEFKSYNYNKNELELISTGWINQIICDNKNRLWFAITGSGGGALMRYDYETDSFINISPSIIKQLNLKNKSFGIWQIYLDSDGYIWTEYPNYGFICYKPENNSIEVFNKNVTQKNSPSYKFSENDLWIASWSGVFIYNKKMNSFINYTHDPNVPSSLSSDKCNKIFHDSRGNIWIATYNGLNKVAFSSSGSITFKHFKHEPQNPSSLSSNLVYDIAEDNNGNLFIATVNGLCLMDRKNNKIYRYFNNEIDNESINSNIVRAVYKDNQGNIWIATNAGIGKLQMKNFKSYAQSFYKNSISHNKVQYFCEMPNSDVCIATPKGIDVFDRKNEKFRFIAGITQNKEGLYGAPLVLQPDADNKGMWIGTWNGGLSHIDYSTNKIINYITKPATQSMVDITSVFLDSKNNLWFSVDKKGIYVYEKETGEYKNFSYDSENENTLSSNFIYAIMEDSDSDIWLGALNGLNMLLDFKKNAFKCYLDGLEIKHIIEDSNKNLWIGTDQGLYRFNKARQQFKKYDINDGLPDNFVFGILEDSSQNFWISTGKGLAKIKLFNDSIVETTVYHEEDGIEVGEFLNRSCAKLSDGTMIFGGTKGFCEFHPNKVKIDSLTPKIVLTNLKVANEIVTIGQKINGQAILRKSITTTKKLTLNHKNNTFSIQFSGIQYNMPQHNRYCYRLEGYDPKDAKWHYTNSTDRYAEYMNLPPGNYTFKVKAANSYGAWNNQPTELEITILSPWWLTFWFISLMVILLVLFIVVIVRIRTYNLHKQKQKLEKIVAQRTTELKEMNVILNERKEELETQMEQMAKMNKEIEDMAKRLHEADQSKIRFFANISHEFRTPLTLIISPLEKFINLKRPIDWDKTNIESNLKLMYKNAKRLFRLINQVIDFRKIESKEKKPNLSNNNIVEFTKEIVDAFSGQAELKDIALNLETQYPTFEFWFDSDIMEKILYNLISNAIKYTPEGGTVSIQLSVNNEQSINNEVLENKNTDDNKLFILHSSLLIKVVDTGIGIQKENLDKIFDRFYREETTENSTIEGTGIGLAYTKELVELHKGSISVESEPTKGTTFIIKFSANKEIYSKEPDTKNVSPINLEYTRSMIELTEYTTETNKNASIDKILEDKLQEQKPNILIVEDNNDLRKFIKEELTPLFIVYEAANGKEGLELANKIEPELIISDIMMPVMNGIELCKRIKTDENTSHIPLILLTAKGSEEDQIKGLETGADDYIPKPFNIDILKIKIKNILLTRKRMQEKFSNTLDVIPSEVTNSILDQKFLQKAIETINKNIGDYEFDNDAFVDSMDYGRTFVYKKIKGITGQSVSEFIRNIRLKAAARLFLEGNHDIADVCYKVGFKRPNHFANYFSKLFGKPPREFIKDTLKE